jgi:hypothetical protein
VAVIEQITRLALYETKAVVPVQVLPAGTHTFPLHVMGNSLSSTVWLKASSGTVHVKYWDFGPGGAEFPGERFELGEHDILSVADTSDRQIITSPHDKPRIELVVTGSVTVGVYVTVLANLAADLEKALHFHQEDADLAHDKGLVVSGYDPVLDEFWMLPIKDGKVNVTGTISTIPGEEGTPYFLRGDLAAIPGTTFTVFTDVVPVATTRKLKQLFVTAYNDGRFSLQINGVEIAAGLVSNVEHNIKFKFDPPRPIVAGATIELKYTADSEPNYPCPITAFLSGNDIT